MSIALNYMPRAGLIANVAARAGENTQRADRTRELSELVSQWRQFEKSQELTREEAAKDRSLQKGESELDRALERERLAQQAALTREQYMMTTDEAEKDRKQQEAMARLNSILAYSERLPNAPGSVYNHNPNGNRYGYNRYGYTGGGSSIGNMSGGMISWA